MLRLTDSRAYLGMAILGISFGVSSPLARDLHPVTMFLFVASCVLFLGFAFCINNCFDRQGDCLNLTKIGRNPVALGIIGFREGVVLAGAVTLGGFCLVMLASGYGPIPLLLYISLFAAGAAYSVPPLRLKGVPVMDLVCHGLGLGVLLFLYGLWATSTCSLDLRLVMVVVSIFLCSVFFEIRNHLDDLGFDQTSGTRTTACWLGREGTAKLLKIVLFSHLSILVLITWMYGPVLCLTPALLMIIPIIVMVRREKLSLVRAVDMYTILVYSLVGVRGLAAWLL